ncbi:PTS sugar transporter subunit IIC [Peptacetobacter hiranonis]|uniref:PTS sugar transporter subunit IIC n=1 Tax=Peptacetobacter hiranonis TaxID=89152 RepID=UPI001916E483|nr:PTS transporter subunit EIIC [Peptacetobacter hiranonis]MED9947049.1 PTS transporter subunit EIIC [Peptacetobacter hiranonis]MEE0248963.1 PTS transporter subunit EIIC [Peptacetobacter hiranonis]QQQ86190.1 PTS sugar transporter subunit IIC [Peptacetobacter hiranonis]
MMKKLEKVLMPLAEAIGRNKYLMSIRDGFLLSTPLLIGGSIFLLIANFPIPAWIEFLEGTVVNQATGQTLAGYISKPADATFTIMAVFAVMGIAYSFAEKLGTNKLFGAATALVSWFLIMPYTVTGEVDVNGVAQAVSLTGVPLGWLGAKGIFVGIFCAFISVHIYTFVEKRGWTIKMPAGVPPTVEESFAALIPAAVVMIIFFAVNLIFGYMGTDVFQIIFEFLQTPLLNLGDTLGAMVIAYIFLHIFWFFGVNGGSVVGAVFNPILQTLSAGNVAGEHHIICQQFQDLFATFGGAGSTLSLVIAMLLFCKSKRIKNLGKMSLVPGIFGINEPILFGLPIVLNPAMLVPFILVPTINIVISYFAMAMNFVPICSGVNIPWTTPLVISGFLATNWVGALLQAALLVLGVFIYMPFIKILDKQYLQEEMSNVEEDDEDISLDDLSFDDL